MGKIHRGNVTSIDVYRLVEKQNAVKRLPESCENTRFEAYQAPPRMKLHLLSTSKLKIPHKVPDNKPNVDTIFI